MSVSSVSTEKMHKKDIYPVLGIISDTHKRLDLQSQAIARLKECGATHILHAGDFESSEALKALSECGLPYAAVFGNNDYALKETASRYRIKAEPYYIKIDNLKIKMMHLPYYMTPDSDIIIYGHLHIFKSSIEGKTLFINPGEVCGRESGNTDAVILYREDDRYIIEHHFKPVYNNSTWQKERKIYPISAN